MAVWKPKEDVAAVKKAEKNPILGTDRPIVVIQSSEYHLSVEQKLDLSGERAGGERRLVYVAEHQRIGYADGGGDELLDRDRHDDREEGAVELPFLGVLHGKKQPFPKENLS